MASNVPSLVATDVFSASSHWNVMKGDMDTLWDAFPQQALCEHFMATPTAGSTTLAFGTNASHPGPWWYQSPSALGDTFTHQVRLAPGTYTFYVRGVKGPTLGQIDWSLSVIGSLVTAQEWYNGAVQYNQVQTVTGIVISDPGLYTLTGAINGKHASSTNYFALLSQYWFK